jgi:hypothetical protein
MDHRKYLALECALYKLATMNLSSPLTNKQAKTVTFVLAALTGIVLAFSLVRPFMAPIGHDQAWGVYMADLWLHGSAIDGKDLVELNPPFLVWFMSLPVLLARVTHLNLIDACRVFFEAIFVGLLSWSALLLRRLTKGDTWLPWLFSIGATIGFMCIIPSEDMGERDHFAALMVMPYLILALFRVRHIRLNRWQEFAIGLTAALGSCLKPQYVLIPIAVEIVLFLLMKFRSFSAATAGFIAFFIPYGIVTLAFYKRFFTEIIPAVSLTYYWYSPNFRHMWGIAKPEVMQTLMILLLALLCSRLVRDENVVAIFFYATVVAFVLYFLQRQGFVYHRAPMRAYAFTLLGVVIAGVIQRWQPPTTLTEKGPVMVGLGMLLAGLLVLPHVLPHMSYHDGRSAKEDISAIYKNYPAQTHVGLIALEPWQFPIVIEQDKVWSSRFMHTWWLPGLLQLDAQFKRHEPGLTSEQQQRAELGEQYSLQYRHEMGEDLEHWKPAVVVYEQYPDTSEAVVHSEGFSNVLEWIKQDPLFASEWSHYHQTQTIHQLTVFVRNPE